MRDAVAVGWIGHRVLWRFLGTHRNLSSGNVACLEALCTGRTLLLSVSAVDTKSAPDSSGLSPPEV